MGDFEVIEEIDIRSTRSDMELAYIVLMFIFLKDTFSFSFIFIIFNSYELRI